MNMQKRRLTDLLRAKYRENPAVFREYLPGAAELLLEPPPRRNKPRSPFGLTEQELRYHYAELEELLEKQREGAVSAEEAAKGLQHCAALIRDDNLPDEVGYDVLKNLVRAVIGKSPSSYRSKTTLSLKENGEISSHERVSAIRGVYLDLDRDTRLVSITINPTKVRERRKLMELVGIGKDPEADVASRHDDYLAGQEPHGAA